MRRGALGRGHIALWLALNLVVLLLTGLIAAQRAKVIGPDRSETLLRLRVERGSWKEPLGTGLMGWGGGEGEREARVRGEVKMRAKVRVRGEEGGGRGAC